MSRYSDPDARRALETWIADYRRQAETAHGYIIPPYEKEAQSCAA